MVNGKIWKDTDGNPIQAHGGMIARFRDTWYWYGENKGVPNVPGTTRVEPLGVSCYSSDDLLRWENRGVVLPVPEGVAVMERPKVMFVPQTGRYVMWFHADSEDYTFAGCGVAASDSPAGPFHMIHIIHPNRLDSRDMTLFTDKDGKQYLFHSSDYNKTMVISELTEDGTDVTGDYTKILAEQEREAPAVFLTRGTYYMISSGCTGWLPNTALYAQTQHLRSGWKLTGDPMSGPDSRRTFEGQSTWVFQAGEEFFLMLDHWHPYDLQSSGYSILPVIFDEAGTMTIPWQDEWNGV